MSGFCVAVISTEWLSAGGSIRDRRVRGASRSRIVILSYGVKSLRRSFCRRYSVGARGEHSRSDAECGGVGVARGRRVGQNRYCRAARDVLRPGPLAPLMNESGLSIVISADGGSAIRTIHRRRLDSSARFARADPMYCCLMPANITNPTLTTEHTDWEWLWDIFSAALRSGNKMSFLRYPLVTEECICPHAKLIQ